MFKWTVRMHEICSNVRFTNKLMQITACLVGIWKLIRFPSFYLEELVWKQFRNIYFICLNETCGSVRILTCKGTILNGMSIMNNVLQNHVNECHAIVHPHSSILFTFYHKLTWPLNPLEGPIVIVIVRPPQSEFVPARGIRPKCACFWLQIKVRHFYQNVPAKQAFTNMCLPSNLVDSTYYGGLLEYIDYLLC